MTDGHVLQTDVEFSHDAGPQVGAATGELRVEVGGGGQEKELFLGSVRRLPG